ELKRRVRLTSVLNCPQVARIREVDLDNDPPFVVLDWFEGMPLVSRYEDHLPLSIGELMPVTQQLAAALAAGHTLGLSHSRLCPSTIRCAATELVSLDFTDIRNGPSEATPRWVEADASCRAPECAAGSEVSSAGDIYSLGAVLFWLLQGRI